MQQRFDYLDYLTAEYDDAFYIAKDKGQGEEERQSAINKMHQISDDILTLNQILKRYNMDSIYLIRK